MFSALYLLWYRARVGVWPGFSLPLALLLPIWLVGSYVLGRYYDFEDPRTDAAIKQLTRTVVAVLFSTAVYLAYAWLTARTISLGDSRSVLLPFLLTMGLGSGLAQFTLNRLLQRRFRPSNRWLVLGTPEVFAAMEQALAWSRLTCRLEFCPAETTVLPQLTDDCAGVVIPEPQVLRPEQIQRLLQLQAEEGVTVVSTLGWFERVLQRFPPPLLTTGDLLRGEFAVRGGSLQLRLKRLGDVLVSGGLLLVTLPLLVLAAILVKLEDGGPVFYSQIRSGLWGEPFRV